MDRTQYIGSSDAAVILGVSPWKSPLQLYQEKIGEYQEEVTEQKQKLFNRGKRWEPVVVEMLVDELKDRGHDVHIINRNNRFRDLEIDYLAAEIDLELLVDGETVNGEMKTVHPFAAKDWGDEDTDEIPIYYTAQVLHGQMVTRREKTIVAALIGADDLRVHMVERDNEIISNMRQKEIEFWDRVKKREAPEPTCLEDVKQLYSKDNGKTVNADDGLFYNICRLKEMKSKAKMLEDQIDSLSLDVKLAIMHDAVVLYEGKEVCTWKKNRDGKDINWKNAFKNLSDLVKRGSVDTENIDKIIEINTSKVIGARVLRVK